MPSKEEIENNIEYKYLNNIKRNMRIYTWRS